MARKSNLDAHGFFMEHGVHPETFTGFIGSNGGNEEDEGEINDRSVSRVIRGLHVLTAMNPEKEINLILSSPGGDVDAGFALFDFIRNLPNPVHITVYGTAHSMGAAILQAGDRRTMSAHSSLMIHDGYSSADGHNRGTVRNWMEHSKLQDKWYETILLTALHSKDPEFSRKRLQNWLVQDTIFTADRCLELGLIDSIIGKRGE